MKAFFKTNKNQILLCTYIIVFAVMAFNWAIIMDSLVYLLELLKPLFLAIAIAFVLNIPMRAIEKILKKMIKKNGWASKFIRSVSIILTLVFCMILCYLLFIIIVPKVSSSLELVFNNFGSLFDNIINSINHIFVQLNIDFRLQDIGAIKELQGLSWKEVFEKAIIIVSGVADGVVSNALAFTNSFLQWFLSFCLSIYFLADKENFMVQIRRVILAFFSMERSKRFFEMGTHANFVFTKFVGGQLVDCAIKGIMFYIILKFIDYPLPELCATLITVFSIVPVFGPIFAMLICAILIFAFDPMKALIFIVIFQVFSNLEAQIIYPKIVGKSIGLPGVWVLLSIFILGDIWGIAGMVMAVPLTALLYTLFSEYVAKRLISKDKAFIKGELVWKGTDGNEKVNHD